MKILHRSAFVVVMLVALAIWASSNVATACDDSSPAGDDNIDCTTDPATNHVLAGDGDDTVTIQENVNVSGRVGGEADNDQMTNNGNIGTNFNGGAGTDTMTNNGYVNNVINGNAGPDFITNNGTVGDDIHGDGGDDTIINNNRVEDDLEGNDGDDSLVNNGFVGEDMEGGDGNDRMTNNGRIVNNFDGEDDDDHLTNNGYVEDDIYGDDGDDTIINNGTVEDDIEGNDDDDVITNNGSVGEDLEGGDGDDTVNQNLNGTVGQFIEGDDGFDILNFTGEMAGFTDTEWREIDAALRAAHAACNPECNGVLNINGHTYTYNTFEQLNNLISFRLWVNDPDALRLRCTTPRIKVFQQRDTIFVLGGYELFEDGFLIAQFETDFEAGDVFTNANRPATAPAWRVEIGPDRENRLLVKDAAGQTFDNLCALNTAD